MKALVEEIKLKKDTMVLKLIVMELETYITLVNGATARTGYCVHSIQSS